jgi:hypothetical protein
LLLYALGDFTPYVGDPDRDVWVIPPTPACQLLLAVPVAVPFAALSALLSAAIRRPVPAPPLRWALATFPGLWALVYYWGPFKELLGGMPPYRVHYELPRGTDRLLISAGCAAGIAAAAAVAAYVSRITLSDVGEVLASGGRK